MATQPPQENRYGFEVWHEDYPVELELPTRQSAPVYERSRRQALERIAANLQGNVRREVWLMAVDFFDRAPEDAAPVLIEAMDRALGSKMLKDVVRNTIEAMGKMGGGAFDDSLRRALEHPDAAVRQAAFTALGTAGSPETIRRTMPAFLHGMDGRAKRAWLRSARLRLGEEAVPLFQQLLSAEIPPPVRDLVIDEAMLMAPAVAVQVLEPSWTDAAGEFKSTLAAVLHRGGHTGATLWLHNELVGDDPRRIVEVLGKLRGGELGKLRDDVMRLSTHPRPEVRLAVADVLVGVEDDDATRTFEVLAGPDELVETKSIALRELTRRGSNEAVTVLLEELRTSTGTRMLLNLRLLAASGDPRAVPVFRARYEESPPGEGREFLQALATCKAPGAARALFELFLQPDRGVTRTNDRGHQLRAVTYIPVLLPNLRGEEDELLALWTELPAGDHVRRALWLKALASVAADREDPALEQRTGDVLRGVLLDRDELPQLRIQALNHLMRKILTMDDVRTLRRLQDPSNTEEDPRMRALVKDLLLEFF
ncbi:MAG: hypothetical protein AB7O97_15845 [Planctomycetota bacterium]